MLTLNWSVYEPSERDRFVEKRREVRYAVDVPAILRLHREREVYLVTILDVSTRGVRVSCPKSLAVRTQIQLTIRNLEVEGEVRYARQTDPSEFHLGILIETEIDPEFLKRISKKTL